FQLFAISGGVGNIVQLVWILRQYIQFFGRSRRFEPLLLNAVERTIIAVSDNFPHQRLLQAVRNVLIGGKMWIEIPDVSEVFITNRTHAIDRNIHPVARSEYILTGLARLEGTSECLTLH